MSNEPLLIDKRRAAYLLDVSVRTINKLVGQGSLQTRSVDGRELLIFRSVKAICDGEVAAAK